MVFLWVVDFCSSDNQHHVHSKRTLVRTFSTHYHTFGHFERFSPTAFRSTDCYNLTGLYWYIHWLSTWKRPYLFHLNNSKQHSELSTYCLFHRWRQPFVKNGFIVNENVCAKYCTHLGIFRTSDICCTSHSIQFRRFFPIFSIVFFYNRIYRKLDIAVRCHI